MSLDTAIPASGSEPPAQREQLARRLEAHPFLRGLPQEQIATLAACATATNFVTDQWIFREGDLANRLYLILDGCVALEAALPGGGTQVIDRIGPGDVLGWSWMFPPFRWHFAARSLVATKAIFVYGTWLLERFETDKVLGYELTRRIAAVAIGRLQSARSKLAGAAFEDRQT